MINIAKDELIGISDVARRLKVRTQTVRGWIRNGTLEAVRVGGRWYTNATCLNAMAKPSQQSAPNPPKTSREQKAAIAAEKQSYTNIQAILGQATT